MIRYYIFFVFLVKGFTSVAQGFHKDLPASEFKAQLDAEADEVLLDLRTPEEIRKGVIPGAVNLDYFQLDFEKQVSKLDKGKVYFIYCATGGRSGETLALMTKLDFKKVYNLKDGFEGWKKEKFPVEVAPK